MSIKITQADKYFSLCVRERAGWKCERCGRDTPDDKRMGLHCSHFHGRGKWSVRFDPENCEALCYGCHQHVGSHPPIHEYRALQRLGTLRFDALQGRAECTFNGRLAKRSQREIAAHYRAEHKRMLAERANGAIGRLEFAGWA